MHITIPFLQKKQKTPATNQEGFDALPAIRLGVTVFIAVAMACVFIFLYRNFYQTIVQAREVIVLKQEVALEDVDLDLFNRVRAVDTYKRQNTLPQSVADPFNAVPLPPEPAVEQPAAQTDADEAPATEEPSL